MSRIAAPPATGSVHPLESATSPSQASSGVGTPAIRLDESLALVRARLADVVAICTAGGVPACPLDGQLLRPLVAMGIAPDSVRDEPEHPFWSALLAIQMAHEASLLHDDIIDEAATRRGRPTMSADQGVGAALIRGDHLLAGGYRLAASTGSMAFTRMFSRAVERTIAGEAAQARLRGRRIDATRCLEIAEEKSGELFGCALAAFTCLSGRPDFERFYGAGRGIGRLYQMLDDLLDYCPSTDTGKPPLTDYAQRRWTWVLAKAPEIGFDRSPDDVVRLLHGCAAARNIASEYDTGSAAGSTMRRCLAEIRGVGEELLEEVASLRGAPVPLLVDLLEGWMERAEAAVSLEETRLGRRDSAAAACRATILRQIPAAGGAAAHLAANSRSFNFASRLLPISEKERIARVYAFCRVTDDLVDELADPRVGPNGDQESGQPDPGAVLEEWEALARFAYSGGSTGLGLLDEAMHDMAEAEIPLRYVSELIEGMRMDLRGQRYASLPDLDLYTYRVASVVGMWITELAGVRDHEVLERAGTLGRAMQLTNILRDVGEDLRLGRLYLPSDVLAAQDLDETALRAMLANPTSIDGRYRAVIEQLIEVAEGEYRKAFSALPYLPSGMQRGFAAAAGIYRGIHDEIRRNGYDNLSRRAHTSTARKVFLSAQSLLALSRARAVRKAVVGTVG